MTAPQITLAWLLAQKPWIVPIRGTTKLHRAEENIVAAELYLDASDLAQIETALANVEAKGDRYQVEGTGIRGWSKQQTRDR